MNEREFNQRAAEVFARIEAALDIIANTTDADIECNLNEGVMQLEFENGGKIIVNRHAPNQEIWVAARSGGFHYAYTEGVWLNARDHSELFSTLGKLISQQSEIANLQI